MYHLGPARPRAGLPAARLPRLGHRRPQQPHQRLLGQRAGRLRVLARHGPARRPITPTRASSCCCPRTSRPGTTSTRTRSGSSRPRCAAPRSRVIDTRLSNTASMADCWLAPWPGSEAALLLAMAHVLVARAPLRPRVRAALGRTGRSTCARSAPTCRSPSTRSTRRSTSCTRRYTPEFAGAGERRRPPRRIVEIARAIGDAGSALATHIWRNTAAGNLGGWQVARALELLVVLMGAVGDAGRHRAQRLEQGDPGAADDAAARQGLERAAHAAGVPARLLRDELPAAALPARRARQARDVLHARLQPRVDQSRRHVVDRDADRRGQGRAARVPDADLERDGVVRGLRAADGPRLRAPRPHVAGDARRALDRLPPAGAARGARAAGQDASTSPGRRTRRPGSARSGRRTSSGSSCRGASIPTARSASASTSSRRIGRARSCASRSSTAGSSRTACPGCRRPRRRRGSRRSSTCGSTAPSSSRTTSTAPTSRRPRREGPRRRHASTRSRKVVSKGGAGGRRGDRRRAPHRASRRPRASSSSSRRR